MGSLKPSSEMPMMAPGMAEAEFAVGMMRRGQSEATHAWRGPQICEMECGGGLRLPSAG